MYINKHKIGKHVRIIGVPKLSGMSSVTKKESEAVFRFLVGKRKKIIGINKHGHAEFQFSIRKGPLKGLHWLTIEPELLADTDEGRKRSSPTQLKSKTI